MRRTPLICTLSTLAAAALCLPSLSVADDGAACRDRLRAATAANALDAGDIKPWHLLLSFQRLDAKGQPRESGTIEEWWAAPNLHKTVYTSPSYTNTELTNEQGFYKLFSELYPPEALMLAVDQVVHPLPAQSEIDDSKPDLRKQDLGKVPLDCIMLDQKITNLAFPPLGLFPTYCLDRDKPSLRVSYVYGSTVVVRNRIGIFQGKSVVTDQSIVVDNVTEVKAHIEKLTGATYTPTDLKPTAEMVKIEEHPVPVSGGVMAGSVLSKVTPVYPERAKANHSSGKVLLHAIIGVDGRIHHLTIMSTPDPDLALAAYSAVRRWTYKPYLLNGQPTPVDTTVTVNFAFGPG